MLIYTYVILAGVLLIVIVYSLLFSKTKTYIPDTTRGGVPCKIHPVHAEFRYIYYSVCNNKKLKTCIARINMLLKSSYKHV